MTHRQDAAPWRFIHSIQFQIACLSRAIRLQRAEWQRQSTTTTHAALVKQPDAPISNLFQVRLQGAYAPALQRPIAGRANFLFDRGIDPRE
jgi:hypothetical protein